MELIELKRVCESRDDLKDSLKDLAIISLRLTELNYKEALASSTDTDDKAGELERLTSEYEIKERELRDKTLEISDAFPEFTFQDLAMLYMV